MYVRSGLCGFFRVAPTKVKSINSTLLVRVSWFTNFVDLQRVATRLLVSL